MATGAMAIVMGLAGSVASSYVSSAIGGGGAAAGYSTGGSSVGSMGFASGVEMMSDFGKSVFNGEKGREEAKYNAQMAELRNYTTMQQGTHSQGVNYREAQLIHQDAEIKLGVLRRALYRKEHSFSGYKGVRIDSGSIVDVKEDTIKQANYDAEIIKYQADINSARYVDRGDMAVWSSYSQSVLNKNQSDFEYSKKISGINNSLMSEATDKLGSLMT